MSNITMCDFCGTIGGAPAGRVSIQIGNGRTYEYARLTGNTQYIDTQVDALTKDACFPCLEKLLVQPTLSLTGGSHPFKDDVDIHEDGSATT